jgi:hypothetical protein
LPFGIETDSFNTASVPNWVWLILLIVGLLLCFFGEIIWEFMVSIIGAIIGSIIGYAIGMIIGGIICAFGLMIVFAIIGSILFQLLAKLAVALLCGLLAFAAAAYLTYLSNPADLNTPVIVGLIVGVIVFVIALFFVEEIVGVFLAAIGGVMVGAAVFFMIRGDSALLIAALAGGSMFGAGAFVQLTMLRDKKKSRGPPPIRRAPVRDQSQRMPGDPTPHPRTPTTPTRPPGSPPSTPPSTPPPGI